MTGLIGFVGLNKAARIVPSGQFRDELQHLWCQVLVQTCGSGRVVAWIGEARDQTSAYRIIHDHHKDRDTRIKTFGGTYASRSIRNDYAHL